LSQLLDTLTRRSFLATALAGCASMQAYREELNQYQTLADRATDHFNKIRVSLTLTPSGVSTYRQPKNIVLNTQAGFEKSLPLLAHELGHHILGHGTSGSAYEMEANAKAVEVLQVWGYSEREGVGMVGEMLCRRQARGPSANLAGHLSAADELEHLKTRFNLPMLHCRAPR